MVDVLDNEVLGSTGAAWEAVIGDSVSPFISLFAGNTSIYRLISFFIHMH
jgi:hypothetical protein